MAIEAFAPAKINLTLHVTGQRPDGYHRLDSLVAFADIGDTVCAEPAERLTLSIDGPQAGGLDAGPDNLVLRAARLLAPDRGAALTLSKRLPVASGIGGGSADAAAALRALSRLWQVPLPATEDVARLGADVPVCIESRPSRMSGIGERLEPVPPLPAADIVLVNPGVPVSTPDVFRAVSDKANPPMPARLPRWTALADFTDWLKGQRNDLQTPATVLQPLIADVLSALRDAGSLYSAMSGSGATCFGLFPPDGHSAKSVVRAECFARRPDWWVAQGRLL